MATEFWPSLEEDLAALNDRAAAALDVVAEPEGLPPKGSWIRAVTIDDDAHASPAGSWHYFVGWNGRAGTIQTRCSWSRPGAELRAAMEHYLGSHHHRPRNRWDRLRLAVERDRPTDGVCGHCARYLAQDERLTDEAEIRRAAAQEAALKTMGLVVALGRGDGRLTFTKAEYEAIVGRYGGPANMAIHVETLGPAGGPNEVRVTLVRKAPGQGDLPT